MFFCFFCFVFFFKESNLVFFLHSASLSIKIGIWIHNLFLFVGIWLHREANLNSQELSLLVEMVVKLKRRTHVEDGHGAMVLGKLPVLGRPTSWISVGQGPTALAVDAGGGCLDIFTLIYPFSTLSPSLWETARYRLKYCLKGPLN